MTRRFSQLSVPNGEVMFRSRRNVPMLALLSLGMVCAPPTFAPGAIHAQGAALPARAEPKVEVKEWNVPWPDTRPRDAMIDAQGRVWFVGQEGNYVAWMDARNGQFKRYEIDPGTNPHTVNINRDGSVWYTGNRNGMIGKLDPATGAIARYPMPDSAARDPHTIAFDKNGDLWFTLQNANMLGHLERKTGRVALVKMSTPQARPYGIEIDAKGRPWFNLFGTNKIATVDPASMRVREYDLPNTRARGRRIAITTDGAVWYVDYSRGFLGRLDPITGAVKEWPAPAGPASLPYAMTVDDDDRLWFVETGIKPNRLVGFDPNTEKFFGHSNIGSNAPNTVRHMTFDRATRTIWFGSDQGTIGRAVIPKRKSLVS